MRLSTFTSLTLVAVTSLFLFACGGGGGGGGAAAPAPAAPTTVTLTADKMTALSPVLNGGTTTITFDFGAANAGKTVTFTASPAATLTPPSTVLDSLGKASTVVSAAPSDVTVNVTASITGFTGTKAIAFIKQPDKVVVHVGLKNAVTNLQTLAISLRNTGATCTYSSYAPTPGHTGFNDSLLVDQLNNFYFLGVLLSGFNVAPSATLLDMTFNSVATGIPYFEIFAPVTATNLSYSTYSVANTNLATTDFIITTDYYLGAAFLATR